MCQFLGLAPIAREEKISVAIHGIPNGNHAIHRQRKLKATIKFCEFDGEDLQGFRGGTGTAVRTTVSRCVWCKLHGTQNSCTQESGGCVRNQHA
jgi:hypothetical protein